MKQRIFSLFTALCLCLTLLPTAALADEENSSGSAPNGSSSTTQTRDCATEGHIDTDNDGLCAVCGVTIADSGTWKNEASDPAFQTYGSGTWSLTEDGTLTILCDDETAAQEITENGCTVNAKVDKAHTKAVAVFTMESMTITVTTTVLNGTPDTTVTVTDQNGDLVSTTETPDAYENKIVTVGSDRVAVKVNPVTDEYGTLVSTHIYRNNTVVVAEVDTTVKDGQVSQTNTSVFGDENQTKVAEAGVLAVGQMPYGEERWPWYKYRNAVKKVVLGDGITLINTECFSEYQNLAEVILPDTLTTIRVHAFELCPALCNIVIPTSVTEIGEGAFDGCTSMDKFVVAEGNNTYSTIDGVLFSADGKTLLYYPAGKTDTEYTVPESVTGIMTLAFKSAKKLTTITLPASFKQVVQRGNFTVGYEEPLDFSSCESLTSINVKEGNTAYKSIDGVLFKNNGDNTLTLLAYPRAKPDSNYEIPHDNMTVTAISDYAFAYAAALTSVIIPDGVTTIGGYAFTSSGLTSITLPASVNNLGYSKVNSSLYDGTAFADCMSLTSINVDKNNSTYKSIDGVLFKNNGDNTLTLTLICYPAGKAGLYTVPSKDGESQVTAIGTQAFEAACSLTSVSIPESVTTIGDVAFMTCVNLVSVFLPASVKSIGARAFEGCYALNHIYYAGNETAWNSMSITSRESWGIAENDPTNTALSIDDEQTTIHYESDGKVTITLDVNGGSLKDGTPESWTTTHFEPANTPPAPTKAGYSFAGWTYTMKIYDIESDRYTTVTRIWNWSDPVYADMTLTARWSQDPDTYSVTLPKIIENGAVKSSHRHAEKGELVTLTVTPDKGYVLETLTVTDKKGNSLELTDKGDGKYTFKMPAGEVTVSVTFAQEKTVTDYFADVPADSYYADAVLWAVNEGITGGIGNGLFAPNETCTRAQIVTFLWRAAGSPEPKAASGFTDVPDNAYYAKAVAWAVENGITGGIGNNQFAPDLTCTRAQAAAFLFRYAAANGMEAVTLQELVGGYGDASQVPDYALSAFNWALANGIVNGYNGNLMPNDDCTRAQIVTMLYRMLSK